MVVSSHTEDFRALVSVNFRIIDSDKEKMPKIAAYIKEMLEEEKFGSEYIEKLPIRVQELNTAQLNGMMAHLKETKNFAVFSMWHDVNQELIRKITPTVEVRNVELRRLEKLEEEADMKREHQEELKRIKIHEAVIVKKKIESFAAMTAEKEIKDKEQERSAAEKLRVLKETGEGEDVRWRLVVAGVGFFLVVVAVVAATVKNIVYVAVALFVGGLFLSCILWKAYEVADIIPVVVEDDELDRQIHARESALKMEAYKALKEKEIAFKAKEAKDKLERRRYRQIKKDKAAEDQAIIAQREAESAAALAALMAKQKQVYVSIEKKRQKLDDRNRKVVDDHAIKAKPLELKKGISLSLLKLLLSGAKFPNNTNPIGIFAIIEITQSDKRTRIKTEVCPPIHVDKKGDYWSFEKFVVHEDSEEGHNSEVVDDEGDEEKAPQITVSELASLMSRRVRVSHSSEEDSVRPSEELEGIHIELHRDDHLSLAEMTVSASPIQSVGVRSTESSHTQPYIEVHLFGVFRRPKRATMEHFELGSVLIDETDIFSLSFNKKGYSYIAKELPSGHGTIVLNVGDNVVVSERKRKESEEEQLRTQYEEEEKLIYYSLGRRWRGSVLTQQISIRTVVIKDLPRPEPTSSASRGTSRSVLGTPVAGTNASYTPGTAGGGSNGAGSSGRTFFAEPVTPSGDFVSITVAALPSESAPETSNSGPGLLVTPSNAGTPLVVKNKKFSGRTLKSGTPVSSKSKKTQKGVTAEIKLLIEVGPGSQYCFVSEPVTYSWPKNPRDTSVAPCSISLPPECATMISSDDFLMISVVTENEGDDSVGLGASRPGTDRGTGGIGFNSRPATVRGSTETPADAGEAIGGGVDFWGPEVSRPPVSSESESKNVQIDFTNTKSRPERLVSDFDYSDLESGLARTDSPGQPAPQTIVSRDSKDPKKQKQLTISTDLVDGEQVGGGPAAGAERPYRVICRYECLAGDIINAPTNAETAAVVSGSESRPALDSTDTKGFFRAEGSTTAPTLPSSSVYGSTVVRPFDTAPVTGTYELEGSSGECVLTEAPLNSDANSSLQLLHTSSCLPNSWARSIDGALLTAAYAPAGSIRIELTSSGEAVAVTDLLAVEDGQEGDNGDDDNDV